MWRPASQNLTEEGSCWFQSSSGGETTRPPLLLARAVGQAGLYGLALQLALWFAT